MSAAATARDITVAGAGIFGLWQAMVLARRGHRVTLVEASAEPFVTSASWLAGAMLAPYCEAEASEPFVVGLGVAGTEIWRRTYPGVTFNGTLVVASPRDRADLIRFGKRTQGHKTLYANALAALEPELADRFPAALYFDGEAHMDPRRAMAFLLAEARAAGVTVRLGETWTPERLTPGHLAIDCRGLGARAELASLRGVRGERVIVSTREVRLARMVRLLHARHPLYVVPWGEGEFMIGATVIESEDAGLPTVRSALEILGAAYAVHPGFAEARILDIAAQVRPAFPDNIPKATVEGRIIRVNGAYRHGFLLAPVLAEAVAEHLASGAVHAELMTVTEPLA